MTKSQQYFQDMIEYNKELFDSFAKVHSDYEKSPKKFQQEFNQKGEEILSVIRKYENMLCGQSEGGKYGKFSSNLSGTFWGIIRKQFPKIDFVGIQE